MKLSIVILTCNSIEWIETCVNALLDTVRISPLEWIVVDNGSEDGSLQLVKRLLPQVNLIQNHVNKGVSKARNQGLKASSGKYVLFLDDDTQVLPNAIDELCDYLNKQPNCAMAGPQLINRDGTLQYNALPFPTVLAKLKRIINNLLGRPHQNPYFHSIESLEPFQPGYLMGACQLIRREVINTVGLLDEHIFYGPEDADFCLRLKKHGFEVVCVPTARVIHFYQRRSYNLKKTSLWWSHIKGLTYFWWKYR